MKFAIQEKISSLPNVAKKVFSLMLAFTVLSLNSIPAYADEVFNKNYIGIYYLDNQTGSVSNIVITDSYANINNYIDTTHKKKFTGTHGAGYIHDGTKGFGAVFDVVYSVKNDGTLGLPLNNYLADGDVKAGLFFSKITIKSYQNGSEFVRN